VSAAGDHEAAIYKFPMVRRRARTGDAPSDLQLLVDTAPIPARAAIPIGLLAALVLVANVIFVMVKQPSEVPLTFLGVGMSVLTATALYCFRTLRGYSEHGIRLYEAAVGVTAMAADDARGAAHYARLLDEAEAMLRHLEMWRLAEDIGRRRVGLYYPR